MFETISGGIITSRNKVFKENRSINQKIKEPNSDWKNNNSELILHEIKSKKQNRKSG